MKPCESKLTAVSLLLFLMLLLAGARPDAASATEIRLTLNVYSDVPFSDVYSGPSTCGMGPPNYRRIENIPPGLAANSICGLYGTPSAEGNWNVSYPIADASTYIVTIIVGDGAASPTVPAAPSQLTLTAGSPQCGDGADNDGDGYTDLADPGCQDASDNDESDPSTTPPPSASFTPVRTGIPVAAPLDEVYPPMSSNGGARWEFMKRQYGDWFNTCAPDGGQRGDNTRECWRYDPMKTLYELARRGELVGDPQPAAMTDAQQTAQEFLDRQYWGSSGTYPDCSGGIADVPDVNKCDMKYWGHASAALLRHKVDGEPLAYDSNQQQLMKQYCFSQGWGPGFLVVDDLGDKYTERWTGLGIQCLVDLHKLGVDVEAELDTAIDYQYQMFTSAVSGQTIGAPMHSMDVHECNGYCPELRYWMFSPWMGSSFLIPSLWEYWVFVDRDPRVAQMIVMYGDAMMRYGVVDPAVWAPGHGPWKLRDNPTPWLTLYFAIPYDKAENIAKQDSEGWYSDLHNPESIFALSAAYFFSCNQEFKDRVDAMWPFFNQTNASENGSPLRIFMWQHRGSASTEWLLENAACP